MGSDFVHQLVKGRVLLSLVGYYREGVWFLLVW